MPEDRKRAEDVYELLSNHRTWVEGQFTTLHGRIDKMAELRLRAGGDEEILGRIQEHEQLMVTVPVMEQTIDALADKVIGEKIPDPLRPGEYLINGKGQPMRKPVRNWPGYVIRFMVQALGLATAVLILINALQPPA